MTGKNSDHTVSEIVEAIQAVAAYAQRRQWETLDACLADLDTKNNSRSWVTAWLRITYPFRSKLKNWDDAVSRARASFGDDEPLLKGLY